MFLSQISKLVRVGDNILYLNVKFHFFYCRKNVIYVIIIQKSSIILEKKLSIMIQQLLSKVSIIKIHTSNQYIKKGRFFHLNCL